MGEEELNGQKIPRVSTILNGADRLGAAKVRLGIGRYSYLVVPGLYAVGSPDENSPVLVTANYKLSFDQLRQRLEGIDAHILVLETMGINVWCAAGKGTFGTEELVRRIEATALPSLVSHRRLVLPQLGAPGVAAHLVRERTGFRVVWGPVEAEDLPAFLASGNRATDNMRRKRFPVRERMALVPMELFPGLKYGLIISVCLLALGGIASIINDTSFLNGMFSNGIPAAFAVLAGIFCGTVIVPLALPMIPGRAFSLKGLWTAVIPGGPLVAAGYLMVGRADAWFEMTGAWFLAMAVSSFTAMNFTGSSTYTSLSGVEKEMRVAVPLQAVVALAGIGLWGVALFALRGSP